jgi:dipeptidyl aminopeptidase/acylaminoacyl peptidase
MTRIIRCCRLHFVSLLLLGVACASPPPPSRSAPPPAAKAVTNTPKTVSADPDQSPQACVARERELGALYAGILDAYGNWGYQLSPDRSQLLFESNRAGGAPQLYLTATASAASLPQIIAESRDPIAGARFTPDGKSILLWRDRDGDDSPQLYLSSLDGGEPRALTNDPTRFHHEPQIAERAKQLVYFRGEHARGEFELVAQSLLGGEVRSIATFQGLHGLSDVDSGGRRALATVLKSQSQGDALLIELSSGKPRVLAPKNDRDALAHTPLFSHDEKSVFVISNEGRERAGLDRIHPDSGKLMASFADDDAEIQAARVSPRGDLVAVLLSTGTHNSLALLDARTLRSKARAELPLGALYLGQFSNDGKSLIASLSTPSAPSDMYLVDTKSGSATPLRAEQRTGLGQLPQLRASVERIKSFDGLAVTTNVYLPSKAAPGQKLPVLVKIHGGPGGSYRVRWSPYTTFYLMNGFAVVEPNVRGSTGFGKDYERADNGRRRMDAVKDLEAVNRWIRDQPWADERRIVAQGGSYGGYLTYMALGHQPELWAGGIAMFGIVNFHTMLASVTGVYRAALQEEFGPDDGDPAFLDSISPIRVADRIGAPLFVFQGQNDVRVPRSEQDQMVIALRARSAPVEYMVAPDEGHALTKRENDIAFQARSLRFIAQHLGLPGLSTHCQRPR